jgi:hypothetical protein
MVKVRQVSVMTDIASELIRTSVKPDNEFVLYAEGRRPQATAGAMACFRIIALSSVLGFRVRTSPFAHFEMYSQ